MSLENVRGHKMRENMISSIVFFNLWSILHFEKEIREEMEPFSSPVKIIFWLSNYNSFIPTKLLLDILIKPVFRKIGKDETETETHRLFAASFGTC